MSSTMTETPAVTVSLDDIGELPEIIKEDPGIIKKYASELPEKALHLGIKIVICIIIFIICRKAIKFLTKLLNKGLKKAGAAKTAITFLETFVSFTLNFLLVLGIFIAFGLNATSAVALLGSLGVTLGLALQDTLSNFAGGVLLLILRPFEAGDYIEETATGMKGTVESITIFYTTILSDNNFEVSIPNGALSNNNIINYSRLPLRRLTLTFNISYEDDLKKAKNILDEVIRRQEHIFEGPNNPIEIYVKELGEYGITLGARAMVECDKYLDFNRVIWSINEEVKLEFDKEGITIPYPQVVMHEPPQKT